MFDVDTLYDNLAQQVRVEFSRPTDYMIKRDIIGAVEHFEMATGPRWAIIHK